VLDERIMIKTHVHRHGETVAQGGVLNDVVISKGTLARMIELKITPSADRLLAKYAQWIEQAEAPGKNAVYDPTSPTPPIKEGNRQPMFNLISMRPDERVCGTCFFWEGARAFQSGMFRFVGDSDGICRRLADEGVSFVKTLTPSTKQCDCDHWRSAEQAN